MVVRMVPMVSPLSLRELYLPLSLRGDEKNIGGHKKKRERYWGIVGTRKKHG
jgi:hypothetical protein